MKRKIKKPLGLLMLTTTSLFSGCDLVDQFISENKDLFGNKDALFADSMVDDDILSDQEIQLPKGKNNGIASNIDNQDDNLAPGSFKIAWYAGGKALKGEEGETALGDLKGAISTFNTERPVVGLKGQGVVSSNSSSLGGLDAQNSGPAITEVQYGSNGFDYNETYDSAYGMSGQHKGALTEEESYLNNFEFTYDSRSGIVTGRYGMTLVEDYSAGISSEDNRSKVKEYFSQLAKDIKAKFSGEKSTKLISALNKLANATGDNIGIGQANNSNSKASALSNRQSVKDMIEGIKEIVTIAKESGIEIQKGKEGNAVVADANVSAPAALNGGQGGAGVGAGIKLAQEVSKADAWAMLDKIVNAKTSDRKGYYQDQNRHKFEYMDANNKDAGELVTGAVNVDKGIGAKTNADFAAAVALKAMSKDGKFSVYNNDTNSDDAKKIKEAAANAVNKVLSALNVIIEKITQKRA